MIIDNTLLHSTQTTPLLSISSPTTSSDTDESPVPSKRFELLEYCIPSTPFSSSYSYKSLAILSGHVGSVSCLALCGEFILSGSQGKDIIVWQQPDLRQFTKFGTGDGSVKALVTVGNKVFTAHQDSRIRVWKVSRRSENVFRLIDTLPTTKDYLGKFMKQSNYVQSRRHHKHLWIEHADSISCLAVYNGLIYSGSWDKTLKVWRISDLKCLESIKAHDDAINGLIASNGIVYSASADGKIKAWGKNQQGGINHSLKGILEGHKDVSVNAVIVSEEEDGEIVYGGGSDGYLMGWLIAENNNNNNYKKENEKSWKRIIEVKAHEMAILCICLSKEYLCVGSADKSISIWKIRRGGRDFVINRVGVVKGHEGPVKCLQASSNCVGVGGGFMLYSGSLDKTVRVWWVPKYRDEAEDDKSLVQRAEKI